ncbi:hypothetical protein DOTSEDRAFT_72313 [Dothistroma septosporum NZE10]|uniref:Uncharacterized protein n=1 Tax=Dothistroma septosporum (strain NZE10 / CBS 128990) TaxID=675120 RepID=M2XJZ1_DOTSN|nr:hypothetical protein DOTSEDRAFT_72313 [Dothistroma septosporum NZE10]
MASGGGLSCARIQSMNSPWLPRNKDSGPAAVLVVGGAIASCFRHMLSFLWGACFCGEARYSLGGKLDF